jgi:crossover junction endodeoxyribonuclease RuvC
VRILGIDPGSRATGYGVVEVDGSRLVRLAGGVIRPGAQLLSERLACIVATLESVIQKTDPQASALESVFTARNPRSALLLGQARGAALVACGIAGLPTEEYAPAQVKRAVVGYGAAGKEQVQRMVQRLLGLASLPATDEADALAVALCHANWSRSPIPPRSAKPRAARRSATPVRRATPR